MLMCIVVKYVSKHVEVLLLYFPFLVANFFFLTPFCFNIKRCIITNLSLSLSRARAHNTHMLVLHAGQVYKLRSPRPGYLASLSTYDSSNPTKYWGFPELSIEKQTLTPPKSSRNSESKTIKSVPIHKDTSLPQEQLSISQMVAFTTLKLHLYLDNLLSLLK